MCKTIALSALKNGTAGFKSYMEPFFEMIPYQKDRQNRLPFFSIGTIPKNAAV